MENSNIRLSLKTSIELITVIEEYYVEKVINRIFTVFDLEQLIHPTLGKFTKEDKANILLKALKSPPDSGPFSDLFQIDLVQFVVDHYYRNEDNSGHSKYVSYDPHFGTVNDSSSFSYKFLPLAISLKRDGYVIMDRVVKKMLPKDIEEAQTENQLTLFLRKFDFTISKGHLDQAIKNHSLGNWAGANSQFRAFIESLLIDICNYILPTNTCENAAKAIKLLSHTANPPFLKSELNEIENKNCTKPFIEGFWKRLHPEGAHPGLSDENDCTFRYHITIVIAYYFLQRLNSRISES